LKVRKRLSKLFPFAKTCLSETDSLEKICYLTKEEVLGKSKESIRESFGLAENGQKEREK
jgi:hypothetical protein